jgi:hypothetical protein
MKVAAQRAARAPGVRRTATPRDRVTLSPAPATDEARCAELARAIAHLLDLGAKR